MSEVQPQPGDKVRAGDTVEVTQTLRGKVYGVDSDGFVRYETEHGQFGAYPDDTVTITVVERADDPSRDPIGTVAELVIDGETFLYVKTDSNTWTEIGGLSRHSVNAGMTGRKVSGAVPGTPAAQQQDEADELVTVPVPKEHSGLSVEQREIKYGRAPLVVQYGDPEPDRHRLFTQPNGARVRWVRDSLWRAVGQPEPIVWNQLARWRFPLTEVVVGP